VGSLKLAGIAYPSALLLNDTGAADIADGLFMDSPNNQPDNHALLLAPVFIP
jgi:hypothetical protein